MKEFFQFYDVGTEFSEEFSSPKISDTKEFTYALWIKVRDGLKFPHAAL